MANPLLDRVAPDYLARRKQVIENVEKLSTFERLTAIVGEDLQALDAELIPKDWQDSPVSVCLRFAWADARERLPEVRGWAEATVPAVCQRCLEPCTLSLRAELKMLLLDSADAQSVDDALEVWGLTDGKLRPIDVIEEMLVMAMPIAAKHESVGDCKQQSVADEPIEVKDTVRPFADLKAQIEKSR